MGRCCCQKNRLLKSTPNLICLISMWKCPTGHDAREDTVGEAAAAAAAEVMAACTAAEAAVPAEDSAGAEAVPAEVAAAAAVVGTAAGIQEIKEAEEEKEGNIPSFLFFY